MSPPTALAAQLLETSASAYAGYAASLLLERRPEVAERYAAVSGRQLGELVFYYAYGLFKIAVIVQQIYYRFERGHTSDPRFANLHHGVRAAATAARQALRLGRIDRLFES